MDPITPPPIDPKANTPVPSGTGGDAATPSTTGASSSATGGDDYNVPQVVLDKYPQLVELIKKTESMTHEEREYWFQILPIMTDEQVNRLKTILEEEAAQLAKLDVQYQDELSKLNQKHLDEWNNFQRKQDRAALQAEEAATKDEEAKKQEDLLKQLDEPGV